MELHFICKQGVNHKRIGNSEYESGDWVIADDTANDAIGGRIFLHEAQNAAAWHGGRILSVRASKETGRKVFVYAVDGPFRVKCKNGWGREKAIIREDEENARNRSSHFAWGAADVEHR
jgi:hypothetical protein